MEANEMETGHWETAETWAAVLNLFWGIDSRTWQEISNVAISVLRIMT